MNYINYINKLLFKKISKKNNFVIYGQNILTGSCIGGFTKNLKNIKNCNSFNTPNSENTLCGMGFGLLINGVSSIFFMKQEDFLLLGVDQLVNTNNYLKQINPKASFTIMPVTVDSGYEGIQASFNKLSELCYLADCKGYTLSSKNEADHILTNIFKENGMRIVTVSQRLFKSEIIDYANHVIIDDCIFKYKDGKNVTIVCVNFALPQGIDLSNRLNKKSISSSIYNITAAHSSNYDKIIKDIYKTKRLIIIDDSKSQINTTQSLQILAYQSGIKSIKIFKRDFLKNIDKPHADIFEISDLELENYIKSDY